MRRGYWHDENTDMEIGSLVPDPFGINGEDLVNSIRDFGSQTASI
jgi:hypothetical protein